MSNHVLVPLDASPQAMDAVTHAIETFPDARLTLLTVIDPIEAGYRAEAVLPSYSESWYENQKEAAEDRFEEARDLAAEADVEITTETEVGRPSRIIVEYIEDQDVDHVVMGSHGRSGVARILLGSVAEAVVRRSPVPVTIVR